MRKAHNWNSVYKTGDILEINKGGQWVDYHANPLSVSEAKKVNFSPLNRLVRIKV